MGVYITKRDVNFGGTIVPAGTTVDLSQYEEDFVTRLVEKGSVVSVENAGEAEAPAKTSTSAPKEKATATASTSTPPTAADPTAPTEAEIAADFQAAGVVDSPDVPQPN